LIDEYQDFSNLFNQLIESILSRNPDIRLFCVGDDWQAINRFAGSDLKFFLNFKSYFPNSTSYNIGANYRCENHIVFNAGEFMARSHIEGKPQRGILRDTGVFLEVPIDDSKFAEDIGTFEWLVSEGGPWEISDNIDKLTVQAYIKKCSDIINANPGKKIMILNRKSRFLGKDLDEIERILKNPKICKLKSPDIEVKTVHRSKGEEADIVILTEVDENSFPIYHPDSTLFSVFDENEITMMEDEARLYYVALTRAKHSIYILYSADAPSCFIKSPVKKGPQKHKINILN
jgi:DNA helicase-4